MEVDLRPVRSGRTRLRRRAPRGDPAEVEQFTRRVGAERPEAPPPSSSREKHEDGGFAVFRHAADMVDLRSAVAVVDELSPDHRFTVPLTRSERERPAGVLALLTARRRAEPVDGHCCSADFESPDDMVDVNRALLDPVPGRRARGPRDVPARRNVGAGADPQRKHVLPVGREDLERISRGRETAEVRYFDVWHGHTVGDGHYLHDLVSRTGSADEAVDGLGRQPTDVLGRLEPGWWVLELGERGFHRSRHVAASMGRLRGFRDRAHGYQAVFRKEDDIYDLGNVLFLARRLPNPYELEYELWTSDGWQPTSRMLLEYTMLPISEEELQRLAAPHPNERAPRRPQALKSLPDTTG